MRSAPILAALAAALLAAPAATACSVVRGYQVPNNLELAERAELILVATVESGKLVPDDPFESTVRVRPTLLLKGKRMPKSLDIEGTWVDDPRLGIDPAGPQPLVTRSDPKELHRVNPDALSGACTRQWFKTGMKLVLFLERYKGKLQVAGYPFARVSEDVPSDDAPWVHAVREYVAVAALPQPQRRAALAARRDALNRTGDETSRLIAADIDRVLAGKRLPPRD